MGTLDEYLETRKLKPKGFRAVPHYFPDGDFVSYFFSAKRCYAKQIDELLTVYYSDATDEMVGCKITGVRSLGIVAEPVQGGLK